MSFDEVAKLLEELNFELRFTDKGTFTVHEMDEGVLWHFDTIGEAEAFGHGLAYMSERMV